MACQNCDTCELISNACICKYSPLKGFAQEDYPDVIEAANSRLEFVTNAHVNSECNLCTGVGVAGYLYTAILESAKFRRYYAMLVYITWLELYGAGQYSRSGLIVKMSDDFSDFRVITQGELQTKLKDLRAILERYESSFLELFKESHSSCYTSSTTCNKCGDDKSCCSCLGNGAIQYNGVIDGQHVAFPNGNRVYYKPFPVQEEHDDDFSIV